jgi:NAD(P)-dependent dehydrogenase (short-subunit alcohol dehydrogenase family)
MTTSLAGAVVLVTGANGGLGEHFVAQALDRGAAKVYATARTPRAWDDERITPLALDITDNGSVAAAARAAADTTVLVNNAGIGGGGGLLAQPVEQTKQMYETNVFGQIRLTRALAPILATNGGGAVVNVLSALSWLAVPGAYSGTKAAFWSVTNTMRLELAPQGTHVLGAHLGYADTPLTARLDVPKNDPRDIVAAIYDGLEAGDLEVLADETSRRVKAALSSPLGALYPALT